MLLIADSSSLPDRNDAACRPPPLGAGAEAAGALGALDADASGAGASFGASFASSFASVLGSSFFGSSALGAGFAAFGYMSAYNTP